MGNLIVREETNNIGRIVTPAVTQPKGNFPHSYVSYTEIYDNNQQQSTQHKIHCGFTAYVFVPQVVIHTHHKPEAFHVWTLIHVHQHTHTNVHILHTK